MATLIIPTSTTLGAYTFEVTLDGLTYLFLMQFNDREGFWYASISDEAGVPVRSGIKVVTNWPLSGRTVDAEFPPGRLYAIDPTDADAEPGLADLGETIFLTYVEEASL